jgi:hypothetical protein
MLHIPNVATPIAINLLCSCIQLSVSKQTTIMLFARSDASSSFVDPRQCLKTCLLICLDSSVLSCASDEWVGGGRGETSKIRDSSGKRRSGARHVNLLRRLAATLPMRRVRHGSDLRLEIEFEVLKFRMFVHDLGSA